MIQIYKKFEILYKFFFNIHKIYFEAVSVLNYILSSKNPLIIFKNVKPIMIDLEDVLHTAPYLGDESTEERNRLTSKNL